jgi:predicted regulator of Ras-like GTPase activity (Roadblock/LC7/MglB family)
MFKSLLSEITQRAGGVLAIALVSLDGIAIEKIQMDPSLNFDTMIAEFTDRMKKTLQAGPEMGTGAARELVAYADDVVVILRAVHDEYYVLCAVADDGFSGRARHAIRTVVPALAQELV